MRNKINSRKKAKIILNLKKYSNVILFSRREDEILQRNNTSYKSLKRFNNKSKNREKEYNNSKLSNPSDDISTFALKTISSFKNSFYSFSTLPKSTKTSLIPKSEKGKQKNINPFLTISSFRKESISRLNKKNNKKSIFCLTQDTIKENDIYFGGRRCHTLNTLYNNSHKNSVIIKEQENRINLLKKIKNKYNQDFDKRDEEYLLNYKLRNFQSDKEKYNISLTLNKLREYKDCNYLNEQRKEISKTRIENSKNNFEFLRDKINSLNHMKQIYINQISNKLGEYSKFISKYKEKERINSDLLLNKINILKKEVKNLQNKISKKEYEKVTILKWIYFFIKMKEKKLVLPSYYKKIIEINFDRIKEKRKSIVLKTEDLKLIQDQHKLFFSHEHKGHSKDNSNKFLSHVKLSTSGNFENSPITLNNNYNNNKTKYVESKFKKKKLKIVPKSTITVKKSSIKTDFLKSSRVNSNTQIINVEENINFELKKKSKNVFDKLIKDGIDNSEINRIIKYKLFLIYNTPEELEDRLQELQNENIQLLKQYEISRKKLYAKKIKYDELFEYKIGDDYNDLNNRIKQKEMILNQKKIKYEKLLKQFSDTKKNLIEKENTINNKQKRRKSCNKKPITHESIRKELFTKIEKLYELCLNNIENKNYFEYYRDKSRKDYIFMLSVIEFFIVDLKSKLNFNDKSDLVKYDLIRKIKNDIEHKHKIEKGEIVRLKEKENYKMFQEAIEEKTNKILFLQKRRIIPVYNLDNMKKKKVIKHEKILNFEDFMFD